MVFSFFSGTTACQEDFEGEVFFPGKVPRRSLWEEEPRAAPRFYILISNFCCTFYC
jgi:hypothetical protein